MRMQTVRHCLLTLAIGLLALAVAKPVPAQTFGELNTAMEMQNTLSGSSTGGYTPSQYFAAPPPSGPGGFAPAGPGGFAPPGAGFPMMMGPGGAPMGPGPAATPAPPPVKKILVLTGDRISCHVMGTLLEDIHFETRPETEKGEYYDDGMHGGDLQASDNIWTNYTERNDVLSAEANRLKIIYLRMLEISEETNPIEFFRIPVATEEPLSRLPRMSDEERDRDETYLRQWHREFLSLYRQDREDPLSDFYPMFVPSPPRVPQIPAPPDNEFNQNAFGLDAYIQQVVDQATAPALEPPPGSAYSEGSRYTRSSRDANEYVGGDRWSRARRDAAAYGTYASSSYFRR